jgi:methylamine dehydrogenase accessory protein MauD
LLSFATSVEAAQKYAIEHKVDKSIPFIVSDDLALSYQVTLAPYGIVIDRQGIVRAKGIVNNYSHIESLLNAEELGVRSLEEYTQRQEVRREGNVQN